MIVKIIDKNNDGTTNHIFFEGDRIYKGYMDTDAPITEGLRFINKKINKSEIRLLICKNEEIIHTIYTNETVYLLNENGKTIERLY